uniref:G_PROTEIN_RECEP_F1_2 domain-containing protein n=1 Tax=Angiostrongylus cantonensis TaxID=6313 RepID=A0A0K0DCQ6_ANGCA
MIASTPFIAQLKTNLTLTISIAAERILALSFPVVFRRLSSYPYATFCLTLGLLLALIDLIVEFSLSPFNKAPNCPSVGCFLSNRFSYYLGVSNMVSFSFLENHLKRV